MNEDQSVIITHEGREHGEGLTDRQTQLEICAVKKWDKDNSLRVTEVLLWLLRATWSSSSTSEYLLTENLYCKPPSFCRK